MSMTLILEVKANKSFLFSESFKVKFLCGLVLQNKHTRSGLVVGSYPVEPRTLNSSQCPKSNWKRTWWNCVGFCS